MANDGFTQETGEQILASGDADAVSYGKLYISNPDLVERFATGAALNEPVPTTFYAEGATGYTDYPLLPDAAQAA
jgi:2,4-dienoyl-CoA reductase-like NADH-dependent reductase (Old Yellow Enzyme family)